MTDCADTEHARPVTTQPSSHGTRMSTTVEQRGRSLGPSPNNQAERRRSQSPNPLFRQEYANKKSQTFDFKHPICEGYLFKQGHFAHVFNKRYFVLYPGRLLYYKSESDFEHDKTRDHLSVSVHVLEQELVFAVMSL